MGSRNSNVVGPFTTVEGQVAPVTFSPQAGHYATAQSVALASATPGAEILYVDSGNSTTPSIVYATPISIASNATIYAIAEKAGLLPSAITNAAYTIGTATGLVWTERVSLPGAGFFAAVAFGNGVFCYADLENVTWRSTDNGTTWTDVDDNGPNDIATDGANVWIQPTGGGTGRRSTDNAATWSAISPNPNAQGYGQGNVHFFNGIWVMAGATSDNSLSSTTYNISSNGGVTWSAPGFLNCVGFVNNTLTDDGTQFIAIVQQTLGVYKYATSTDGAHWTLTAMPSDAIVNMGKIAFGAGKYMAPSNSSVGGAHVYVATSVAGLAAASPTVINFGVTADGAVSAVGYGARAGFIAFGNHKGVSSSPDGVTWTPGTSNMAATGAEGLALAFGDNTYVAACEFDIITQP